MALDYSKWDALELSDDSDIEVHPNVDKRSFIRAKQAQIHLERERRKQEIETLKYERIINDGLLRRIKSFSSALKRHEKEPRNLDEVVFQALVESAGDPDDDTPPKPPPGVHTQVKDQPTYSKMMGALVDQVKKAVDDSKPVDPYQAYIKEVKGHETKVQNLQKDLLQKLGELEKEAHKHITSEDIHTGFDSTYISQSKKSEPATTKGKSKKTTAETIEILNPGTAKRDEFTRQDSGAISSGAEADVEDAGADLDEDAEHIEPSPAGKEFGNIGVGQYRKCFEYISEHPSVLAERETDGLLIQAFNEQEKGHETLSYQYIHQALLLQYCRSLGPDGVSLFFKRVTTPNHQAGKIFHDDVTTTFNRIKNRVAELAAQNATAPQGQSNQVEQIQLHAVDPGTQIQINVPKANSDDPKEKAARKIFESFPPGLQRALGTNSLDEVNKVLGKMSVEEAEEVVQQLGEGGMLSIEENIIDATTEDGQAAIEQMTKERQMEREKESMKDVKPEDVENLTIEESESEKTEAAKRTAVGLTPDPE